MPEDIPKLADEALQEAADLARKEFTLLRTEMSDNVRTKSRTRWSANFRPRSPTALAEARMRFQGTYMHRAPKVAMWRVGSSRRLWE